MGISIHALVVTPLASNCYIVFDDETKRGVIVDPGGDEDEILSTVTEDGLKIEAILNTHGHIDHIGANAAVRRATGAPIYVHADDAPMLASRRLSGADWLEMEYEEHKHDHLIEAGKKLPLPAPFDFDVLHTPGHSLGSVMFVHHEKGFVLGGDVLFQGSVGRTDLPGGNEQQLMRTLARVLGPLPDSMIVLPGHGEPTTLGEEREGNPYMRQAIKRFGKE